MSDILSMASYADYPTDRPFINTSIPPPKRPVKAFPESSGAAILSALQNLQEKIRKLELQRVHEEQNLRQLTRESSQMLDFPEKEQDGRKSTGKVRNHDLASQLAAAEAKCSLLEKQLDYMRRMIRSTKSDRSAVLKSRESMRELNDVNEKLEKLEMLEREYRRLTQTQNAAEEKIRHLERKMQLEEHQRKLVQQKASQIQTGLEANRMLIQSVSPHQTKLPRNKATRQVSKRSKQQRHSYSQPHYRLSLGDVPFVAGTSTGTSHSVRANVQHVLHLLKQHNRQLCNEHVLKASPPTGSIENLECQSSSSSSSHCTEELSELLLALQDEFGHMSFEHQELAKQIEACRSDRLRRDLECEMEILLKKMEGKGEQIAKVRRHQSLLEKMKRQCRRQHDELKVTSALKVKSRPGERSKNSLRLLKDMRTLQSSLRAEQPSWYY